MRRPGTAGIEVGVLVRSEVREYSSTCGRGDGDGEQEGDGDGDDGRENDGDGGGAVTHARWKRDLSVYVSVWCLRLCLTWSVRCRFVSAEQWEPALGLRDGAAFVGSSHPGKCRFASGVRLKYCILMPYFQVCVSAHRTAYLAAASMRCSRHSRHHGKRAEHAGTGWGHGLGDKLSPGSVGTLRTAGTMCPS